MLNHPQYHTVPSTTHKCPESININHKFYVESNMYTYIHVTASLLDPHDIHHEGKKSYYIADSILVLFFSFSPLETMIDLRLPVK